MKKVKLRAAYGYDNDLVSLETGIEFYEPTMTQQQFKDDSDINTIVNRFLRTGQLPDAKEGGRYGDFLDVPLDYHTAMNFIIDAQHAFDDLPSGLRARFNNDPGELLDFLSDPKNREEGERLGLFDKPHPAPSEPVKTDSVPVQTGSFDD